MVRVPGIGPRTCEDGGVTRGTPGVLHLVVGDEEFLAERAVNEVIAAARAADPDTVVSEHRAADTTPAEFENVVSPSLFGGRRVVVIQAAQDAKKDLAAALLSYVGDPDPDITLVFSHAGGAKGKALADGVRAAGAEVTTAAKLTKHRERIDFIRAEVRRLGGTCPEAAAEALLTAVGNDLRDIAAACAQLVADTGGRVDSATIARYYRGRAEVSGFTVADATMVGDVGGALEALRWALYIGVDPVPIADALADGIRTVARVAGAGRGNAYQLASTLGMPPWKVERAQRQARGWTADGLVDAMRVAADCNAAVKGGADDRSYALERAVIAVAAARSGSDR
ncbi:DNA polymerase III subunit delta [Luedemannella helvata]|uniref:DNA polymerase III subunit delta n=1 Tax=Luedemannella helvata TaxID=349315 RepID=UPI0031D334CC